MRALTPAMFDHTNQFIRRSPPTTKVDYTNLEKSVDGNVRSSTSAIQQISENKKTVSSFKGISADLNVAVARFEYVIDSLIGEVTKYKGAYEALQTVLAREQASHEPKEEQAAL
jgi:hypothetical protein